MPVVPGLRAGASEALLWVRELRKAYGGAHKFGRSTRGVVHALDGVSFDVRRGEVLGVVGESGSGKSTLARCILRLVREDDGEIVFDGVDLAAVRASDLRRLRKRLQCCFQDPYASLDPRYSVGDLISEPLLIHGVKSARQRTAAVGEILDLVGISRSAVARKPHQFSGGQRQRVGLARALVLKPDLVILDEPVSALDVSVQAQILNLLADLRDQLSLTYILIVHDLLVAEYFCDRVAVVYAGRVMELATGGEIFSRPLHPYTVSLLAASPVPEPAVARRQISTGIEAEAALEQRPLGGCPFRLRCPVGRDRQVCAEETPPLAEHRKGHWAACHFPGQLEQPRYPSEPRIEVQ
jgi:oligopeptide/dipeptide ABC transporter ATP-binding protein